MVALRSLLKNVAIPGGRGKASLFSFKGSEAKLANASKLELKCNVCGVVV